MHNFTKTYDSFLPNTWWKKQKYTNKNKAKVLFNKIKLVRFVGYFTEILDLFIINFVSFKKYDLLKDINNKNTKIFALLSIILILLYEAKASDGFL